VALRVLVSGTGAGAGAGTAGAGAEGAGASLGDGLPAGWQTSWTTPKVEAGLGTRVGRSGTPGTERRAAAGAEARSGQAAVSSGCMESRDKEVKQAK